MILIWYKKVLCKFQFQNSERDIAVGKTVRLPNERLAWVQDTCFLESSYFNDSKDDSHDEKSSQSILDVPAMSTIGTMYRLEFGLSVKNRKWRRLPVSHQTSQVFWVVLFLTDYWQWRMCSNCNQWELCCKYKDAMIRWLFDSLFVRLLVFE